MWWVAKNLNNCRRDSDGLVIGEYQTVGMERESFTSLIAKRMKQRPSFTDYRLPTDGYCGWRLILAHLLKKSGPIVCTIEELFQYADELPESCCWVKPRMNTDSCNWADFIRVGLHINGRHSMGINLDIKACVKSDKVWHLMVTADYGAKATAGDVFKAMYTNLPIPMHHEREPKTQFIGVKSRVKKKKYTAIQ
jgi:hypothetical protein